MTRHLLTVCNKLKTFSSQSNFYILISHLIVKVIIQQENLKAKSLMVVIILEKQIRDLTREGGDGYADICRGGGSALGRRLNGFEENDG